MSLAKWVSLNFFSYVIYDELISVHPGCSIEATDLLSADFFRSYFVLMLFI